MDKNTLGGRFEKFVMKKCTINEFDCIKICNLRSDDKGVEFEKIILASLSLIKDLDPRRYSRIKEEVTWILNSNKPQKDGAQYIRQNKICDINFNNYSEDSVLVSADYAGYIIHEATHGYLKTKGFKTTPENRVQIERICTTEENRFYKLIEDTYPRYEGMLIREFDPRNWHYSWNTPKYKKIYDNLKRVFQDHSG